MFTTLSEITTLSETYTELLQKKIELENLQELYDTHKELLIRKKDLQAKYKMDNSEITFTEICDTLHLIYVTNVYISKKVHKDNFEPLWTKYKETTKKLSETFNNPDTDLNRIQQETYYKERRQYEKELFYTNL